MTEEQKAIVRAAMSVIRDMAYDWPTRELFMQPEEICELLAQMIGETFDFERD